MLDFEAMVVRLINPLKWLAFTANRRPVMRHVFVIRASSLLSKKVLKWSAARELVLDQP
jgi:hypothetical protein